LARFARLDRYAIHRRDGFEQRERITVRVMLTANPAYCAVGFFKREQAPTAPVGSIASEP
jgi:hypothetical protein